MPVKTGVAADEIDLRMNNQRTGNLPGSDHGNF